MGIYLDIDLDYIVKPVEIKSINGIRSYAGNDCSVGGFEILMERLKSLGLDKALDKKFFTSHRKSYTYWWIKKRMDMTLIHIDAHSDLYRNRSYDITGLKDTDMGCDDYIWYALRDGFISRLYWIVPEGLLDFKNKELHRKFISDEMLIDFKNYDDKLEMTFKVLTRIGEKKIPYTICTADKLCIREKPELMTVATSPEFVPLKADESIFSALKELGASYSDVERITKMHTEMPRG